MAETGRTVTHERRLRTGWYDKYAPKDKSGLDIGCANDPIHPDVVDGSWVRYDWNIDPSFDAQTLPTLTGKQFHTVYASHILEHLSDPFSAIRRWLSAVEQDGHLIICVPHRDLYEQQRTLPSRRNAEHKSLWLPEGTELPYTFGLSDVVELVCGYHWNDFEVLDMNVLDEGYEDHGEGHPNGEYAIEIVVKRL